MKDSLLNLVPGYSGKTGCFGTIVVNVGDVEDSGSSSAIPPRSDWMPLSIGVLGSRGSWTSLVDASGLSESWSIDSGSGWIFADSNVDEIVRYSLSGLHPTSGAFCVWPGDSTFISLFGRCEQFGNELLHSRSRILSRILHISHGIDMIFYETSTKTYFNPPDYTHMHSRTDINQHGRQLIRSSSPSAVLIITPSRSAELNILTPSNNSHPVK